MSEEVHVLTAFTVLVTHDGQAIAVTDLFPAGIAVDRVSDLGIVRRACEQIADDLRTHDLVQRVVEATAPMIPKTPFQVVMDGLEKRQSNG